MGSKNWLFQVYYESQSLAKQCAKCMPFVIPMIWREPKDHSTDCYFCTTNISGSTSKLKKCITYPNLISAIRPIPHSEELVIQKPPTNIVISQIYAFYYKSEFNVRISKFVLQCC